MKNQMTIMLKEGLAKDDEQLSMFEELKMKEEAQLELKNEIEKLKKHIEIVTLRCVVVGLCCVVLCCVVLCCGVL